MQPLRARASTRACLLIGVSAVTLAVASCDPFPAASVSVGPQPRSRMPESDSVRAIVTRVLARHGLKPDATSCEGTGQLFSGDVPDAGWFGEIRIPLRACLSVGPDTAEIYFRESRRAFRLIKGSAAIVRSLADSLRPFVNVRVDKW